MTQQCKCGKRTWKKWGNMLICKSCGHKIENENKTVENQK